MTFTLVPRASHDALQPRLSPAMRPRLRGVPAPAPTYTAILFAGDRPVRGRLAARALARATAADPDAPVVAVAEEFTHEALVALRAAGATIVAKSEHFWTDASHERIRRIIAAGPRAPDVRDAPRDPLPDDDPAS